MSVSQTFGATVALVAAEFADYDPFATGTSPSSTQVEGYIEDAASEVLQVLRGQSLDPVAVAADQDSAAYCQKTIVLGAAWQCAAVMRGVAATRKDPYGRRFYERLNRIKETPSGFESWGSGSGQSVITQNATNPEAGVRTTYDNRWVRRRYIW